MQMISRLQGRAGLFVLLIGAHVGLGGCRTLSGIFNPVPPKDAPTTTVAENKWLGVSTGSSRTISGLSLLAGGGGKAGVFLVAVDGKGDAAKDPRFARLSVDGLVVSFEPLTLRAGNVVPPVDVESIAAVPGTPDEFIAVASQGALYRIKYSGEREVSVLGVRKFGTLARGSNVEGFDLKRLGQKPVAVWAHRGDENGPAVLYWGFWTEGRAPIAAVGQWSFQVTLGVPAVRSVSDLRLDADGEVYAIAASDPGDAGPFSSALFHLGTLRVEGEKLQFAPRSPPRLLVSIPLHKVEGFELLGSTAKRGWALGSDDESAGAAFAFHP